MKKTALERAVDKFCSAPLVESYMGKPQHMVLCAPFAFDGSFIPEEERQYQPDFSYAAPARQPFANLAHWYPSVILYFAHSAYV